LAVGDATLARTHAQPWARYLLKPSDHGSYPNKIIDSSRVSNIRSIYKQIPNAQPIAAPTSGQERQEVPGDDDVETTRRAFAATPAPVLREVAGCGMMRGISASQECQNPPLDEAERDPSPYEACQELFSRYPLALRVSGQDSSVRSMVLMLADGGEPRFFVLSHDCDNGWCGYSIGPWPTGDSTDIEPGGDAHVPGAVTTALNSGIPLPRHGSMFGWTHQHAITALIVIYTDYDSARPLPRWTVMPLAGTPEPHWPPFTGRPFFGSWFWDYYWAGGIVPLDSLIAETPDTIFWVNTRVMLGSDCCAVAYDSTSAERDTLKRGCYVYSEVLRACAQIPSLKELLAEPDKVDLSTRFQRTADRAVSSECKADPELD